MKVYSLDQIEKVIDIPYLMQEIEQGLVLHSQGQTITSPIGFLHFLTPPGDVHIKSAGLLNGDFYIVKIASSFYENPQLGLSSSNGLMLLFSQKNGQLLGVFLDEGRLTDLRTALVGAIVAKYLAPKNVAKIGIVGTGIQAREQLLSLAHVIDCKDVVIWGRNPLHAEAFAKDPRLKGYKLSIAKSIEELASECRLIITATASKEPLLFGHQIQPGTHVTAVGADSIGKQELDATVFEVADLIVLDSLSQCQIFGDYSYAKHLPNLSIIELGTLIANPPGSQVNTITVADLTGLAIEDLQITKGVYSKLKQ